MVNCCKCLCNCLHLLSICTICFFLVVFIIKLSNLCILLFNKILFCLDVKV